MKTREQLEAMGADGLWRWDQPPCGCRLDDFEPCVDGQCDECVPAVLGSDGLMYPMEAT